MVLVGTILLFSSLCLQTISERKDSKDIQTAAYVTCGIGVAMYLIAIFGG